MEKKMKTRSRSYPGASLKDCVAMIADIEKSFGIGISMDRNQIAKALKMSPKGGATFQRIGALVHFDLLSISGSKYKITENAVKILRPCTDGEKEEIIKEIFFSPVLYSQITEDLRGAEKIPEQLANIVHRNYGISASACEKAASIFKESGIFAGIFDENGFFIQQDNAKKLLDSTTNSLLSESHTSANIQESNPKVLYSSEDYERFEKNLSYGKATILIPSKITAKDFEKIKKLVELIELNIE